MPLQLVSTPAPPDLERFSQDLAEGVPAGEVLGLGVIVILKGRRFFVDCFGVMARSPFEYIGTLGELEHCLRELGRKRKDTSTTL